MEERTTNFTSGVNIQDEGENSNVEDNEELTINNFCEHLLAAIVGIIRTYWRATVLFTINTLFVIGAVWDIVLYITLKINTEQLFNLIGLLTPILLLLAAVFNIVFYRTFFKITWVALLGSRNETLRELLEPSRSTVKQEQTFNQLKELTYKLLLYLGVGLNIITMQWYYIDSELLGGKILYIITRVGFFFYAIDFIDESLKPVEYLTDYLYRLNNNITAYGKKCNEKKESLRRIELKNRPCSSRPTASSQPMYSRETTVDLSQNNAEESTAFLVEESTASVVEESTASLVKESAASLVEDFLEYVEEAYQEMIRPMKSFTTLSPKTFCYCAALTVFVINTMQAANFNVRYYKGNINQTETRYWWILYVVVMVVSFVLLLWTISMALLVRDRSKQTSILFNKALFNVDKQYITSSVASKTFNVTHGVLEEINIIIFWLVDITKPFAWTLIVATIKNVFEIGGWNPEINGGNSTLHMY